jgi:hypothetical protein
MRMTVIRDATGGRTLLKGIQRMNNDVIDVYKEYNLNDIISKTQDFPEFLFDERTALASFDIYSAYNVFLNNINLGFTYDYPDENIKKEIQKKLLDIKARFKYPFSLIVEAT